MNEARRKEIEESGKDLDTVKRKVVGIRSDELGYLADILPTMQSYKSRTTSENAINSLSDVIKHINKAIDEMDKIP